MPVLDCLPCSSSTQPQILERDITIVRGDDTQIAYLLRDPNTYALIDLTGFTFAAKAKSAVDGALWTTATVTHNNTGGRVVITFPKAETTLLIPGAAGRWDLQATEPGGGVRTIITGDVTVVGDIT